MPSFEVFQRGLWRRYTRPVVTLYRVGRLGLNRAALDLLGQPEAVVLLFDRQARVIGLRSSDSNHPQAYRVQRQPSGGGAMVGAKAFLQFYGIPYEMTPSYCAQKDGDVLVVDVTSPRRPPPPPAAAEA